MWHIFGNIWTKYFYSKVYQIKVISIETKKNNVNTIRIILQNIFLKLLYLWLKIVLEVENIYLGHDLHFITGKPPQLKTICPVHVLQFYYNNWKCLSHLNLWISLIILICICRGHLYACWVCFYVCGVCYWP